MNLRLLALSGAVLGAVALPLAVASAGQVGDGGRTVVRDLVRSSAPPAAVRQAPGRTSDVRPSDARPSDVRPSDAGASDAGLSGAGLSAGRPSVDDDYKAPFAGADRSPLLLGLGLATAARCGPELSSPEGIEAQTCVLTQGEETWARTYYRNATGTALDAVLSLMGPGAHTVQMHCVVGAGDEPDSCETPRERTEGAPGDYTAVAEFAARRGSGPLLLRVGSNSEDVTGS
ncbi:hypothetical protein ACFYZI_17910 [Streptomyces griseorubiginosus]|uniref:Uncharacterized protein n=1 Tax=Streptomyces griseorubiginosus TaxID=67304 RepID=A0A101RU73_9ACTN|nr:MULTISPECIES: hypothetical protein [Streptomyces]KUM75479.1 hypothetical protein AQI84_17075 [Streptomyces griseorubiginosus]KUN61827.1 hypothetical protein AQJ54_32345 [Streptomyces griseorubiginosus]